MSRCRLIKVDDLDLHVEELDAVDGTPVLDITPWSSEFGPRGEIKQPTWTTRCLGCTSRSRTDAGEPTGR
ncbi:TrmO family methyltransferase domain-containing protein [Micromonospora deserti]|uniref:TrmO family methyltransferase domain-containing protein n=1 Tax=Micromonospora deserti TaxID=2070366 RepID=UPI001F37632F|nr:TrmO family methyltransferase [Micromonospora deserti]